MGKILLDFGSTGRCIFQTHSMETICQEGSQIGFDSCSSKLQDLIWKMLLGEDLCLFINPIELSRLPGKDILRFKP